MDPELLTRLQKLEERRKALNAQFDLTKECKSIEELEKRISVMSDGISMIKNDIQCLSDCLISSCDKLNDIYVALREASSRYELLSRLSLLNQLCKQIEHLDVSKNEKLFHKVAHDFRVVYEPLKGSLSKRTDLPYVHCANKLLHLETQLPKAPISLPAT